MFEEKIAQVIVEKYKDEEAIDLVLDALLSVQQLLDPTKIDADKLSFSAGVAVEEISYATKILRAHRAKKYGQKPFTAL